MDVADKQIRRILCPAGVGTELQGEFFDIMTDVVSAPCPYANPRANNDDRGMADMVAVMTQAVLPGSHERITPPDKKYNHPGRHPLRLAAVDEDSFGTYMDEYKEIFPEDMTEFGENTTNYLHAHPTMGDKQILEYITNGPPRVFINKTHEYLAELHEKIRRLSRKEGASFNHGPAPATLKFYSDGLMKIRKRGTSRRDIILKNYIFLRNASEIDWQDPKILAGIWAEVHQAQELAKLCIRPAVQFDTNDPDPEEVSLTPSTGKMTCGHCRSSKLHYLIRPAIGGGRNSCPLRHLSNSVAKDARLRITNAYDADGSLIHINEAFMKPHIKAAKANA